jgi:hypothetical protein
MGTTSWSPDVPLIVVRARKPKLDMRLSNFL